MSVDECQDMARFAVLTRLGDSWIFRAATSDRDAAEAEAFRWRRIYGPGRTLIASLGQFSEAKPSASNLPALPLVIDVEAEAVVSPPPAANDDGRLPASLPAAWQVRRDRRLAAKPSAKPLGPAKPLGWGETLLRALALYLGYLLANRLIDVSLQVQSGLG